MLKTKITAEERQILVAFNRDSPLLLVRLKAQAIMASDQGLSSKSIAMNVGKGIRAIERWLSDWNGRRMASIFSGHQDNTNAAKLTKAQLAQIKEILSRPPSEYGIPKEMWDVPTLKDYVSATFGVAYESPESYYFILRFSGLSFKYPDTFDLKRNEQLIEERMRAIAAELAPLLTDDTWEVFASDEVRMDQEAVIRKCWLKKRSTNDHQGGPQKTISKLHRFSEPEKLPVPSLRDALAKQ